MRAEWMSKSSFGLLLWLSSTGVAQVNGAGAPSRVNERWQERVAGLAVPVTIVLQVGDEPAGGGGEMVDLLNAPFTDGGGRVGFNGALTSGERFIWIDDAIVFLDSSVGGSILSGSESAMGISDSDGFLYSPIVDGGDAVWSHNGLVLRENVQAPGFPTGTNNTFNHRPTMLPGGQAYWVSGFDDTGGTSTLGTMLYMSATASSGDISVVLRSDDLVDDLAIDRPSGIGYDFQISDNGAHHIHELLMVTGSTLDDGALYVDGSLVARESQPTGDGANWLRFGVVGINNTGDYLFSGADDGGAASDEFLAYNGRIAVLEGDTIDGVSLTSPAAVLGASINNAGWVVHAWSRQGGDQELLFASCEASDPESSVLLAATGDEVDVDDDGSGDAILRDFNAWDVTGPDLWLAEDSRVYGNVDLDFGAGWVSAIVAFELPCARVIFADGFESGDTTGWTSKGP